MAAIFTLKLVIFLIEKISNGGDIFLFYRGKNGINSVNFIGVKMAGIYIIPILFLQRVYICDTLFKFQIAF
jgi:hypothetical protein